MGQISANNKAVTVEPVLFLYIAGWNLMLVVGAAGLYWKVCEQNFGGPNGTANCSQQPYPPEIEDFVQKQTAIWGLIEWIAVAIPLLVAGPLFGALGDKYGRRWNMLLGFFGCSMYAVLYFLQFRFVQWPLFIIPIACVLLAFIGYGANIFATCYSYVADVTKDDNELTVRYTILETVAKSSDIVFSFVNAVIIQAFHFSYSMLFAMALWASAAIYAMVFLKQQPIVIKSGKLATKRLSVVAEFEKVPLRRETSLVMEDSGAKEEEEQTNGKHRKSCWKPCQVIVELAKDSIQTATRKRPGNRRLHLWLCIASLFVMRCADAGWMVLNLFAFHSPISWSGYDVSIFYGCNSIFTAFGTLLGSYILKTRLQFHETTIVLVGVVSYAGQYVWTGLSRSGSSLYFAGVLGLFSSLPGPASKALVNQFIERDEVGKALTLVCLANDMGWIIAFACSNSLYALTVDVFPGLVFFASAALILIGALPIVWFHFDLKKQESSTMVSRKLSKMAGATVLLSDSDLTSKNPEADEEKQALTSISEDTFAEEGQHDEDDGKVADLEANCRDPKSGRD